MADSLHVLADRVLSRFSEIRLAYLFGSEARAQARKTSDVDVAILPDGPLSLERYGRIRDALATALDRRVDRIDLSVAPPLLIRKVISEGQVLVCRDQRERARFEARSMARFLDTRRLRDIQHEYLRRLAEARRAG
jgi:predicted nucleotidyltransferase